MIGEAEPFFHRDGDRLVPTQQAKGPWKANSLHGRVIAGLLAAEARGRAAGLGLWGELDLAEVAPEGAFARIGRFALVSGTVVRVVPRSEETYLDFGHDWRRDFGVRIRVPEAVTG
mgnify:CR=1 FL=1